MDFFTADALVGRHIAAFHTAHRKGQTTGTYQASHNSIAGNSLSIDLDNPLLQAAAAADDTFEDSDRGEARTIARAAREAAYIAYAETL